MHYYQHNIGDYARDTGHLSVLEHGIYRLILDWCYLNEKPITAEQAIRIGRGNPTETQSVLSEFFSQNSDGWEHKRVNAEIEAFHSKSKRNRENGAKGGRPKPTNNPVGYQSDAKHNPNQEPITNNQEYPHTPSVAGGHVDQKKPSAVSLETWLENIKSKGEQPIPPTDPVFAYAEQAGIPMEYMRLAWAEFRARYTEPGAKLYRDWRTVYRKAVRGNWFKLWFCTADGEYALTTTGTQALRTMQAKQAAREGVEA